MQQLCLRADCIGIKWVVLGSGVYSVRSRKGISSCSDRAWATGNSVAIFSRNRMDPRQPPCAFVRTVRLARHARRSRLDERALHRFLCADRALLCPWFHSGNEAGFPRVCIQSPLIRFRVNHRLWQRDTKRLSAVLALKENKMALFFGKASMGSKESRIKRLDNDRSFGLERQAS